MFLSYIHLQYRFHRLEIWTSATSVIRWKFVNKFTKRSILLRNLTLFVNGIIFNCFAYNTYLLRYFVSTLYTNNSQLTVVSEQCNAQCYNFDLYLSLATTLNSCSTFQSTCFFIYLFLGAICKCYFMQLHCPKVYDINDLHIHSIMKQLHFSSN